MASTPTATRTGPTTSTSTATAPPWKSAGCPSAAASNQTMSGIRVSVGCMYTFVPKLTWLMVVSTLYRVTHLLVQNLPLTSKEKFRFGLACPGLARPKRNFSYGRFCTRRLVTLYMGLHLVHFITDTSNFRVVLCPL